MIKRAVITRNDGPTEWMHLFKIGEIVEFFEKRETVGGNTVYTFSDNSKYQSIVRGNFEWIEEDEPKKYRHSETFDSTFRDTPHLVELAEVKVEYVRIAAFRTAEEARRYVKQLEEEQS